MHQVICQRQDYIYKFLLREKSINALLKLLNYQYKEMPAVTENRDVNLLYVVVGK